MRAWVEPAGSSRRLVVEWDQHRDPCALRVEGIAFCPEGRPLQAVSCGRAAVQHGGRAVAGMPLTNIDVDSPVGSVSLRLERWAESSMALRTAVDPLPHTRHTAIRVGPATELLGISVTAGAEDGTVDAVLDLWLGAPHSAVDVRASVGLGAEAHGSVRTDRARRAALEIMGIERPRPDRDLRLVIEVAALEGVATLGDVAISPPPDRALPALPLFPGMTATRDAQGRVSWSGAAQAEGGSAQVVIVAEGGAREELRRRIHPGDAVEGTSMGAHAGPGEVWVHLRLDRTADTTFEGVLPANPTPPAPIRAPASVGSVVVTGAWVLAEAREDEPALSSVWLRVSNPSAELAVVSCRLAVGEQSTRTGLELLPGQERLLQASVDVGGLFVATVTVSEPAEWIAGRVPYR